MTTSAAGPMVPCPDCEGHGEIGTRQNYWGQWDTEQCRRCAGECEIPAAPRDTYGVGLVIT